MSKVLIDTKFRGVYDPETLYHMFDEVTDPINGTDNVVLVALEARGQTYLDRNIWRPKNEC